MPKLSHYGKRGQVQMVDVSAKQVTTRTAKAHGCVKMALNFTPRSLQPRKPAWKWKLWWRLLPRPSRFTTCAKLWTKGWRSSASTWLKKPAERAAISIVKSRRSGSRPGAASDESGPRKNHRQVAVGGRQSVGAGAGVSRHRARLRH